MSPQSKKNIVWWSVALGVIFLIGGGILSARGQFNPPPGESGEGWMAALIDQLSQREQQAVNPTEQALLQDKLNRLQQVEAARQSAGLLAQPTLTLGVCPPPEPTLSIEDLPQGLLDLEESDYRELDLMAVNGWRGQVNGNWITALAGWQVSNPAQGILALFTFNAPLQVEAAPAQGGALRIASAEGYRLTLLDDQGRVYFYDLAARRWLNSADEIVPTLPPVPTFTPAWAPCP